MGQFDTMVRRTWTADEGASILPAMAADSPELVDPDPFSIGLGLFSIIASGVAFLETRRSRQFVEQSQREHFRAAWFQSRRSLIFFKQAVDEFETYMLEDAYGRKAFRIGSVRLMVTRGRHQSMRRLHGQTMTTANYMADNLDDLSDFLGPEDQAKVDEILQKMSDVRFPELYRDVIISARGAVELYSDLLDEIGEREGFGQTDS